MKSFQKIQVQLVHELEKKFSGKHVVFCSEFCLSQLEKVTPKISKSIPGTDAVHDLILEKLVFPSETVCKRVCSKLDGSCS